MTHVKTLAICLLGAVLLGCSDGEYVEADYWTMHTIDDLLEGADGVDLYDVDGDGDIDALSSWEESAMVLLHENPGPGLVRDRWARTNIGGGLDMRKVEDARYVDLDEDGQVDAVVTATENRSEKVGMHWLKRLHSPHAEDSWVANWLEPDVNYLFVKIATGQIDGDGAIDIAVGSKSDSKPARLLWYQAPPNPVPANVSAWRAHDIAGIEWTDSIEIVDVNGDGASDILMNYWHHLAWYENPRDLSMGSQPWNEHMISSTTNSYFSRCDEPGSAPAAMRLVVGADISGALIGEPVAWLVAKELDQDANWSGRWLQHRITSPDAVPRDPSRQNYSVKGIACGNIDDDPRPDIVISVSGHGHGVFALLNLSNEPGDQRLRQTTIASALPNSHKGIKFDDIRLADVDLDGDLDVVTTEENGSRGWWWSSRGLGLIWYENPGLPPVSGN
jgi:hypothetical protein